MTLRARFPQEEHTLEYGDQGLHGIGSQPAPDGLSPGTIIREPGCSYRRAPPDHEETD